jgi:hypothetical protein
MNLVRAAWGRDALVEKKLKQAITLGSFHFSGEVGKFPRGPTAK